MDVNGCVNIRDMRSHGLHTDGKTSSSDAAKSLKNSKNEYSCEETDNYKNDLHVHDEKSNQIVSGGIGDRKDGSVYYEPCRNGIRNNLSDGMVVGEGVSENQLHERKSSVSKMCDTKLRDLLGEGVNQPECPKCGKRFSTKQSLSTHMKTAMSCVDKDKQRKIFQCNYCQKVLSSKQMLLYHDGICSRKTQHEYEKKLEQLQTIISNGDISGAVAKGSGNHENVQFYEMNILMKCNLVNNFARIPEKRSGLEFELYPAMEGSIEIESLTKVTVPLGLQIRIPNGWYGNISLSKECIEEGINSVSTMHEPNCTEEIKIVIFNMNDVSWTLDVTRPIAKIVFCRYSENFNIHLNCIRQVVC